jgi:hypothetical protein
MVAVRPRVSRLPMAVDRVTSGDPGTAGLPLLLDLGVSGVPKQPLRIPRKEVIQPHLPVRLPCYDFTPVTRLTLDTGVPEGFAQRLQAPHAPMV